MKTILHLKDLVSSCARQTADQSCVDDDVDARPRSEKRVEAISLSHSLSGVDV